MNYVGTGRNGDNSVWRASHLALRSHSFLNGIATSFVWHVAHGVDCVVTALGVFMSL